MPTPTPRPQPSIDIHRPVPPQENWGNEGGQNLGETPQAPPTKPPKK